MTSTFARSVWIGERRACKVRVSRCVHQMSYYFDVYGDDGDDGAQGFSLSVQGEGEGGRAVLVKGTYGIRRQHDRGPCAGGGRPSPSEVASFLQ